MEPDDYDCECDYPDDFDDNFRSCAKTLIS